MMQMLGAFLILGGGVWGRCRQLGQQRRGRECRRQLIVALRRMGEEIRLTRTPLPTLLERLGKDCTGEAAEFFGAAAKCLRQGEDMRRVWKTLVFALPVPPTEQKILAELGADLDKDEQTICQAVTLTCKQLQLWSQNEDKRFVEEEKRITALWLSGAALLVILLI